VIRRGWILRLALLLFLQTLVVITGVELFWPRDRLPAPAAALVCLGGGASRAALNEDSRARANRCAALYHAGVAPVIYFTGAVAAPLMAELAEAQDVPRTAIFVEDQSLSTLQNALFTSEMAPVDGRIAVVSSAYHLPRAAISFRVMGFREISLTAAGAPSLRPRPILREVLATWFNMGRVVLWWVTPWLDTDTRAALLA
jgi:uncharacterized SAM-binding protein YcdF (DUF218 family)